MRIVMLLLLVSCVLRFPDEIEANKEKAKKYATDSCSCSLGLNRIHYLTETYEFACNDGGSYGKNIPYDSEYLGNICK